MNSNPAIQNQANIAWDGAAATLHDIRKHVNFGWQFEVVGAIAVDAVFKIVSAVPNAANDCVPAAGRTDVPAIARCDGALVPGEVAEVTIPAGTPVGTVCSGTVPCRPAAFLGLAAVSGTTENVRAIMLRQYPIGGSYGGLSPAGQA